MKFISYGDKFFNLNNIKVIAFRNKEEFLQVFFDGELKYKIRVKDQDVALKLKDNMVADFDHFLENPKHENFEISYRVWGHKIYPLDDGKGVDSIRKYETYY